MSKDTFSVVGLTDQRSAYEVEEFLLGIPEIQDVNADFLDSEIVVEYNESELNEGQILDQIEYAGCKPANRITGIVDQIKTKFRAM